MACLIKSNDLELIVAHVIRAFSQRLYALLVRNTSSRPNDEDMSETGSDGRLSTGIGIVNLNTNIRCSIVILYNTKKIDHNITDKACTVNPLNTKLNGILKKSLK